MLRIQRINHDIDSFCCTPLFSGTASAMLSRDAWFDATVKELDNLMVLFRWLGRIIAIDMDHGP